MTICSSRVARWADGANSAPPCDSHVPGRNWRPPLKPLPVFVAQLPPASHLASASQTLMPRAADASSARAMRAASPPGERTGAGPACGVQPREAPPGIGAGRGHLQRVLERAGRQSAGAGDVPVREQERPGRGSVRRRERAGAHEAALQPPPGRHVRERVDGSVVAVREQGVGVHLEVEVRRRPGCVARVADEADHRARADARALDSRRSEAGQVRVVEEITGVIGEPETATAEPVPADREERPVGDGHDRRPVRGEDVDAVVPGHVGARRAPRVGKRRRPGDGEDVRDRPRAAASRCAAGPGASRRPQAGAS